LRLEAEDRGRRSEGRDQRTEVKKSEIRGRKKDETGMGGDGDQRAGGRLQRAA